MTPRERAATALTLGIPDEVPTFELEFQLEEEMFGRPFLRQHQLRRKSIAERERMIRENAEYMIRVYSELEYSIIPIHYLDEEGIRATARAIRNLTGDQFMLTTHGDGTFSIPTGDNMVEFSVWLMERPADAKRTAAQRARRAVERNKRHIDAGIDCFILCDDYCFNQGPFMSPRMFRQFIQPYLARIIAETRQAGAFTIKHTDGNIMPILDQLVECNPHGLHSIDPMAGVDIRKVKRLVGDRVCLCGNVHCAALQTGTDAEVVESSEYCLTHAKPGGGYIFCTSNIPFKGMLPARYKMILEIWRRMRAY